MSILLIIFLIFLEDGSFYQQFFGFFNGSDIGQRASIILLKKINSKGVLIHYPFNL